MSTPDDDGLTVEAILAKKDQQAAEAASIGEQIATFYATLKKAGLTAATCNALTFKYADWVLGAAEDE